ncbi:MAG: S-methyl-5'-thioadenosine phosphorylase [Candidatus Aminicenantes bacterium]|nr:S-methyl-5'-thioadenosine phosphorylase [Candidatus Aminicenantes bacterium]
MAREAKAQVARAAIGILGGTGLYDIEGLTEVREVRLATPFGEPSDAYVVGQLAGRSVAFLSRHGRGHRLLPAEINYRANIYGFKVLGVERLISVNSVGSLRQEIRPRDIVFADQFFDRTRRPNTFFGEGLAAHISFAQPVCAGLSRLLYDTAAGLGLRAHLGGTYICIEGPTFSSRAESRIYRAWGCDVIGMTSATEAKLSREAEICYATMNLATDYDVWHESEASVSVELILENLRYNVDHAKAIIRKTVAALGPEREGDCGCGDALKNTLVTRVDLIPAETKAALRPLIEKYVPY